MAKIGFEVEGKYALLDQKLLTYFCSAEEYIEADYIVDQMIDHGVEHIYISDHHNQIDLNALADYFAPYTFVVTVELTELHELPPPGIEIFWNASQASYAQARTINFLRPGDQVKVEHQKCVFSWMVGNAIVTLPEDFEGDREV